MADNKKPNDAMQEIMSDDDALDAHGDSGKEDWLKKYQGAMVKVPCELGSPMLNNVFKRTFYFTSRNIFYIQVFGPMILDDQEMARTEEALKKMIMDAHAEIEREIAQAEEVIRAAGIIDRASYNAPRRLEAAITSPLSRLHLSLFTNADRLMLSLSTLWLQGEIEGKEKGNAEYRLKKLLRGIAMKVRNMYFELRKKQSQKGDKQGVVAADADDDLDEVMYAEEDLRELGQGRLSP